MTILAVVSAAFIIMLVSLSGALFATRLLGNRIEKNITYLISFSAGVFLIVAFSLAQEAIEILSLVIALTAIVGGVAIFYILGLLLPEPHHHEHESHRKHIHSRRTAHRILFSDAVHNVTDGIILVPAFLISPQLGVLTALGIIIHEFVQEVSEYFVLRGAGYSAPQALIRNFLVATTILIGVVIGFTLSSTELLEGILLGVAAGGFLYVVAADLLPQSLNNAKNKRQQFVFLVLALIGAAVILMLNTITGETHMHGESDHGHEEEHDHP